MEDIVEQAAVGRFTWLQKDAQSWGAAQYSWSDHCTSRSVDMYTETHSHAHLFSVVVVVVLRHTFRIAHTSALLPFKVGLKSHSTRSSFTDLLSLNATVTTSTSTT